VRQAITPITQGSNQPPREDSKNFFPRRRDQVDIRGAMELDCLMSFASLAPRIGTKPLADRMLVITQHKKGQ
jgi:hypothetical protein